MAEPAVLDRLRDVGILAVLRAPTPDAAVAAVDALVAGGVRGIEVTYSTPGAAEAIAEIRRRHAEEVYLGAGTVLTAAQAARRFPPGPASWSVRAPTNG